jgi:hypothetical protein
MRPDGRLNGAIHRRSLFPCGAPQIPSVAESDIPYILILTRHEITVKKRRNHFVNFVLFNTKTLGLCAVFV